MGCANGELLFFLHQKFSNIEFCGIDVRNDLIKLAKKNVLQIFILKDLTTHKTKILIKNFDIIISSGVIPIFFDTILIFFLKI